ncbi:hypothetical protein CH272_13420 [Rhodococcus sp. 05-340-1]|nr:hypothetical protein CH271_21935 [Rhodococcus sp. 05-340-2]OZD76662.1 hypothetical protein CH272_13420 [Rhodococcus sp. 05-340-1]
MRRQVSEQEKDIAFLKKASAYFAPINQSLAVHLLAAEYANSAVHRMARLLEVSAAGLYKHHGPSMTTALDQRRQRRAGPEIKILAIH